MRSWWSDGVLNRSMFAAIYVRSWSGGRKVSENQIIIIISGLQQDTVEHGNFVSNEIVKLWVIKLWCLVPAWFPKLLFLIRWSVNQYSTTDSCVLTYSYFGYILFSQTHLSLLSYNCSILFNKYPLLVR